VSPDFAEFIHRRSVQKGAITATSGVAISPNTFLFTITPKSMETTPLLSYPTAQVSHGGPTESISLIKLSQTVYILRPATPSSPSAPSAILLFAWMGAPVRHMTKFVEHYSTKLFPGTPIILVLTPTNKFIAAEKERRGDMQPAVTAFESLDVPSDNVLVHTFSNGGVSALRTFMSLLSHDKEFSPRELVVDSAPGISTLGSAVAAFTADVKNPVMKFFLSIFLGVMYCGLTMKSWFLGKEPMLHELRGWLGDATVIGKKTRRVVLYSDDDQLVQKESVEWHIGELKRKGIQVDSTNFGETRHVGHMRANPELYWNEILRVWNK
jgi:hypothetical protein